MIRFLLGAAVAAAAMITSSAHAADLPRGGYLAAPYTVFNWSGFYVGLNAGYQWGSVTNSGFSPAGIAGGVQAGYNWQSSNFVYGLESDLQLSGADDVFAAHKFSNPWFGTFRGRAGFAFSNVLLYLTGGFAYGDGRLDFAGLSETHSHFGWTIGGGIEVGLTPQWSAKAEYLYFDLTDRGYALTGSSNGIQSSVFRLGVNYRF
jgi:outer membrane immunogenic protein